MLSQASSVIKTLKNQWHSAANEDEFELFLYAAAQDEYDSGVGNKGLLAKIGAEVGFDENKTKAAYLKVRTAQLMVRKESILAEMVQIQTLSAELEVLEQKFNSVTHDQSDNSLAKARQTVKKRMDSHLEYARASHPLRSALIMFPILSTLFGVGGFAFGISGISVGVLLALALSTRIYRLDAKEFAKAEADFNDMLLNKDELIQDELDAIATEERKKVEVMRTNIAALISSRDAAAQRLEILFQ